MLVEIASHWKKGIGLLLGFALLLALSPVFSAQAQNTSVLALVRGRGATLYDAPGGDALRTLAPGDRLDATGRTDDATWITGAVADGEVGWLRVADVIIYDLRTLPVVEGVAAPASSPAVVTGQTDAASGPAATATATPSPTPLPSPTPTPTPTPLAPPNGGKTVTGVVRGGGAALRTAPQVGWWRTRPSARL